MGVEGARAPPLNRKAVDPVPVLPPRYPSSHFSQSSSFHSLPTNSFFHLTNNITLSYSKFSSFSFQNSHPPVFALPLLIAIIVVAVFSYSAALFHISIIQLFRNSHLPDFVLPLLIAVAVVAVFRYSAALMFSSPLSLTPLTTYYFLSKMDQSAPLPSCGSDMAETPTTATNGSGRDSCEACSDDNTHARNPEHTFKPRLRTERPTSRISSASVSQLLGSVPQSFWITLQDEMGSRHPPVHSGSAPTAENAALATAVAVGVEGGGGLATATTEQPAATETAANSATVTEGLAVEGIASLASTWGTTDIANGGACELLWGDDDDDGDELGSNRKPSTQDETDTIPSGIGGIGLEDKRFNNELMKIEEGKGKNREHDTRTIKQH